MLGGAHALAALYPAIKMGNGDVGYGQFLQRSVLNSWTRILGVIISDVNQ